MEKFDLIILGSGPGGYVTAIRASQLGLKTAIIEKESLGGVCLNWGCIPTKALLKSAQVFDYIKHSEDYGITVENFDKNFDNVINRSRKVAQTMSKGVNFLMKKNKIKIFEGFGQLSPNKTIKITDQNGSESKITGEKIIIATGARSRELPFLKKDGKKIIGYREAMTLDKQPKDIVIVGSGAIGIEFAYFYNSMGTSVTIVEYMDRIVPVEDSEISKELEKSLKKKGINILTSTEVEKAEINSSNSVDVTLKTSNGEKNIMSAEIVLSAVGIKANIENIGLEDLGIKTEKDKILVDDFYMTNVKDYYAIGDVVKGQALAHVASAEGILCVEKIAGHDVNPLDYNNIPGCTYCSPEIASVGFTEKQAIENGFEVKIGKFPFSASGKAQASGKSEGFVKVIFDAKYGEWLGCHMIGEGVTDMIAEAVVGRKLETTGYEILKTVHPHPTMSEAVMEAVAAAYDEVIHL
ncbi:MAG: dihydrolipoyl dehydrogenase [Flavobacteriaceae bacterium]|nr:dihydrolipoyl dehydrogenase [Flavobacteriaceae bacterium]MDC3221146.1 dihydrolipoyl dehydrogenase [Flavobacteriaceae bacterium]MDG1031378.1 dihydrolipoyl dehydrogenase [Flavobacteriaceae bacterium]MDG1344176.1 dihydrolipoyl dehydrogenase [Flavobacteriaceae bacterium]MDG1792227.1 dihydrolipoyl dehydrogenase [Flavobacteriaceae bacterium]|tara:strand:+ start:512 stop:1909 length:1398 start_codon:yes stop_codon:yes gene_type:complete